MQDYSLKQNEAQLCKINKQGSLFIYLLVVVVVVDVLCFPSSFACRPYCLCLFLCFLRLFLSFSFFGLFFLGGGGRGGGLGVKHPFYFSSSSVVHQAYFIGSFFLRLNLIYRVFFFLFSEWTVS